MTERTRTVSRMRGWRVAFTFAAALLLLGLLIAMIAAPAPATGRAVAALLPPDKL